MDARLKVIILQRKQRRLTSVQQKWISLLLLLAGISLGFNISFFTTRGMVAKEKVIISLTNATATSRRTSNLPIIVGLGDVLPENFLRNATNKSVDKKFVLRPWYVEKFFNQEREKIFMLFLVKSACKLGHRRDQVRATWGTVEQVNEEKFAIVFLVGFADEACQSSLDQESQEYGDILQANVPDDYLNLPDKVLSGYRWVAREMGDVSDFYVFVDDDCVVNVASVHNYFYTNRENLILSNNIYCGLKYNDNAVPIRANDTEFPESNKYVVSKGAYSKSKYPKFCHGGMTALTFPILIDIHSVSEVTQRGDFHLEDVYITGILREKLGRGDQNIQPVGFDGTKSRSSVAAGSFVWHVGHLKNLNFAFSAVWKSMLKLVTVRVGSFTRRGSLMTWRDVVVHLNKRGTSYL